MSQGFYYTNHHEIVNRLSKKFKNKDFNPDDVHDWCAELENDILREHDYFVKFLEIPLTIISGKYITIPCNVHSIIDIYFENKVRPRYTHIGNQIYLFVEVTDEFLYIDYKGTPVDLDTGDVMILRGHELACEWTCIKNIFTEDYLNGKIDGQRWSVISEEYEMSLNVATMDMRRMTKGDFQTMENILGNKIPIIGRVPLYKKGGF
jgi:hypothetical protein